MQQLPKRIKALTAVLGIALTAAHLTPAPAASSREQNRAMLVQTLSEEKTEIQHLAAQQAMFRKMNTPSATALARMFGTWIREHKAGAPTLERLIRQNGGDPAQAKVLKPAKLGTMAEMVNATHNAHRQAVQTSQMRYMKTSSSAIKAAMHKRANLARKHIRQLTPYLNGDAARANGGDMMPGRDAEDALQPEMSGETPLEGNVAGEGGPDPTETFAAPVGNIPGSSLPIESDREDAAEPSE